jgi:hypothetical protein
MTIQEEGIKSCDFSAGSRGGAIGATYVYPSASSSGTIGRSARRRHHDFCLFAKGRLSGASTAVNRCHGSIQIVSPHGGASQLPQPLPSALGPRVGRAGAYHERTRTPSPGDPQALVSTLYAHFGDERSLAQSEFFEICGLDLDATTETLRAGLSSSS